MMRIMICDDQQSDLDKIAALCEDYAAERNQELFISKERDPQNLEV